MLHSKFRRNRFAGSGEDFRRVFTTYGHGGHLGHVTSVMLIHIKDYIQNLDKNG